MGLWCGREKEEEVNFDSHGNLSVVDIMVMHVTSSLGTSGRISPISDLK